MAKQPDTKAVLLSPMAWDGIYDLCKRYRTRKHGVSQLLEYLPDDLTLYADRRPQDWKDNDEAMLELGEFPQWSYELPRLQKLVTIKPKTIEKLATIAEHFAITSSFHKSKWNLPMSRVNALLEAIGTGLLGVHDNR